MVKNTTGGKKHKKAKNIVKDEKLIESDNEFQFYAKVNKKLGGGNFSVDVFIPEKREKQNINGVKVEVSTRAEQIKTNQIALIRGSIKKRCRINVGNIILVSLREFEERKVDILHSYSFEDVAKLRRKNKLPKCRIFENDNSSEINFDESDTEDTEYIEDNELINNESEFKQPPKNKGVYTSNYDLIPDFEEQEEYAEYTEDTEYNNQDDFIDNI